MKTVNGRKFVRRVSGAFVALSALFVADAAAAIMCPFCSATMQTLSEEIAGADAAVIAQLAKAVPASAASDAGVGAVDPAAANATFQIVEALRGQEKLGDAKEIEVVYFGQDPPEKKFLITGIAAITPEKLDWTTPVPLSDRAVDYVRKLPAVPKSGVDRLAFFQDYLEDDDPLLAQDAYDEFARMPYADVLALGPRMRRDKLIAWINDPAVGPTGRRLYLTMLGICGQPEDIAMLEGFLNFDYQLLKPAIAAAIGAASLIPASPGVGIMDEMIHADERRKKESLDALIACYLKLKGPEGLSLINEKYLGNPAVEYKHLHAALMALRFHGQETDVLPREKLLDSMRLALAHRDFADQVIPDLTRWEDWEVMPRLVKMFKESPSDDWIRQPVVSYLLVAIEQPGEVGENAKAALAELESLDPETVERAKSLAAFSMLASRTAPAPAASGADGTAAPVAANAGAENAKPVGPVASAETSATKTKADLPAEVAAKAPGKRTAQTLPAAAVSISAPSRLKIIGVPLVAAVVLLAIFAVLLRGTDPRSSDENP